MGSRRCNHGRIDSFFSLDLSVLASFVLALGSDIRSDVSQPRAIGIDGTSLFSRSPEISTGGWNPLDSGRWDLRDKRTARVLRSVSARFASVIPKRTGVLLLLASGCPLISVNGRKTAEKGNPRRAIEGSIGRWVAAPTPILRIRCAQIDHWQASVLRLSARQSFPV